MSYEKVKSISIKDNKVFINCASNNVYPLTYYNQEYPYFSKILQEQGEDALNIALLKEFEAGNLQSSNKNLKWVKALRVLFYVYGDEYNKFNWRILSCEDRDKVENSEEFKALLQKALNTKTSKEKFIIRKKYDGRFIYGRKITSRHLFYTERESEAKVFDFEQEAEEELRRFGVNNAEVIKINKPIDLNTCNHIVII